jgi:hypothetical protein
MQHLTQQFVGNYREHPSFEFEAGSWTVPKDQLATFNQTYLAVRQMGAVLDGSTTSAMQRICRVALDDVFSSMSAQCVDDFETRFLQELWSECVRLLAEELAWYAKAARPHFVELTEACVLQDAIRMQVVRHYFGRLPRSAVDEVCRLGAKELARFRANASAGKLTREDLSVNAGPTVRAIRTVLNREFKSLGVLDAVSAYTGRKTRVVGLALELSVPLATWWKNAIQGIERPPKTLYAHLDEGISFPGSSSIPL